MINATFSGGIDSLAGVIYAKELGLTNIYYVDMHHEYAKKEKCAVESICKKAGWEYTILDNLDFSRWELKDIDATIPYRNAFIILALANEMKGEGKIIGQFYQVGEHGHDRSKEFIDDMNNILGRYRNIKVEVPFANYTKTQIVKYICDKGFKDLLKDTVGCYSKEDGNCGNCKACIRRWIALESNDIESRSWFATDPATSPLIDYYAKKLDQYELERKNDMEKVFKKYGLI
jgi:7-cyano-7-deazaguanine synthase in queuosine biosynthesis